MRFKDFSRKIRAPLNRISALNKLNQFHSRERSVDEIVDNAINLNTKGLYRVDSVQKREEILALAQAVKSINPKTILEIGTCNGGTFFIWTNLASERAITCDLNASKIRNELYNRFPPPHSKCDVISLAGDSHKQEFLETVKNALNGNPVDFLFIDGDHTEDGVKQDYDMYSPLVRSGGIIAFHDILEKQPTPNNQVYHFWEEIKKSNNTEEFVKDYEQTGFGIGIIRLD